MELLLLGLVDKTSIVKASNLSLEKFCLTEELENIFHTKVKIRNDAKACTMAEKKYGALKNYKDCLFLCVGTGIGGAAFINNKLLESNNFSGFEFGHMVIEKDGLKCTCGKRGCFEAYCSIKKFKDSALEILKELYGDEFSIPTKELPNEIKKNINNEKIKKLIDMFIEDLIVGVSNIIDIFEPEVICFGGSFVYFKEILYDLFVLEMKKRKYVYNKDTLPEMVLAKLKNDAGLIGPTID